MDFISIMQERKGSVQLSHSTGAFASGPFLPGFNFPEMPYFRIVNGLISAISPYKPFG